MKKTIIYSLGVISVIELGRFLMVSTNIWIGIIGIVVSIVGFGLTGLFVYNRTPVLINEFKRLRKR